MLSARLYLPQSFFGLPLFLGVEITLGTAILNKVSGFYGILSLVTGHPIEFSQWIFYTSSLILVPFYLDGLRNVRTPSLSKFCLISLIYLGDTLVSIFYILFFAMQWFGDNSNGATAPAAAASSGASAAISASTNSVVATATAVVSAVVSAQAEVLNTVTATAAATTEVLTATAATTAAAAATTVYELETPRLFARDDLSRQSASPTYELMTTLLASIIVAVFRLYFTTVIFSFTRHLLKSTKYGVDKDEDQDLAIENETSRFRRWILQLQKKSVGVFIRILNE